MQEANGTVLFVKVPHWVIDFQMKADLNGTQFRIFSTIVRYTFGYNQDEHWLSVSFLSNLMDCNEEQVKRELRRLVQRGIVLQRTEMKKRYLRINPKIGDGLGSYVGDGSGSYIGDGLAPHIKKDTKEKRNKEKYYINSERIDDIPFLKIYLNLYKKITGRKHVRISEDSFTFIDNQISYLIDMGTTEEEWIEQSTEYLKEEIPKGNNGSIVYFLNISYRYFDVGRYDQFET